MLLYIVRHGDPIYNPDSLTPKGHLQAQALAKRFALHGLDKIFVSPMIRAQMTAKPTCEILGIKPVVQEWTSEELAYSQLSVREKDGRSHWVFAVQTTKMKNDDTVKVNDKWYDTEVMKTCPTVKQGVERIRNCSDEFLTMLGYERQGTVYKITKPNDERVAVFCHEGFGLTWMSQLLDIPPHIFWSSFSVTHSGVSIFNFANNPDGLTTPQCLCFSDNSHIYKEGLPYKHQNVIDL